MREARGAWCSLRPESLIRPLSATWGLGVAFVIVALKRPQWSDSPFMPLLPSRLCLSFGSPYAQPYSTCLSLPHSRRYSAALSASGLIIHVLSFFGGEMDWWFSFSSLDCCQLPGCLLPDGPMAASFHQLPQLLPVKLNCPSSSRPLQSLPRSLTSYRHILRNCCRLALFASSPWNSWPWWREGESGNLHWKPWKKWSYMLYMPCPAVW